MNFKKIITLMLLLCLLPALAAQTWVKVANNPEEGWRLLVDGEPISIHGMVWAFTPIGDNYSYNLWDKSEEFIQQMIDRDAVLMQEMGVNVIRSFSMIPPKWVTYLYERYGIYSVINDMFARYGLSVDGRWMGRTDYSDLRTREVILEQVRETAETYKGVPGVLFYLLGNENNYGLEWSSDAIEDLPVGQRLEVRAGYLYSLFEEGIQVVKSVDPTKPVGIVNGDIQYLNIISELVPSLDILGVNTYRGRYAHSLFYESVDATLNVPIVFTELGADAFNIKTGKEDQFAQADIVKDQWEEIYLQSYGKGGEQNALGAFVFEWIDEWWKHGMTEGLFEHDKTGTWSNGAYEFDNVSGRNNMNEEWFGIVYQSPYLEDGISRRRLRAVYYVLQDIWELDQLESTAEEIAAHFDDINLEMIALRTDITALEQEKLEDPIVSVEGSLSFATRAEFDDLSIDTDIKRGLTLSDGEWLYLTTKLKPLENLTAELTLRLQGNVPDTVLYDEETSRFEFLDVSSTVVTNKDGDATDLNVLNRLPIEIYSAEFSYDTEMFTLDGYFHNGHTDWVAEGDFFNLLPESFDFVGMDLDNSRAPIGIEYTGKQLFEGLKIYGGPEPYWGAEPQVFVKYYNPGSVLSYAVLWNEALTVVDPAIADGTHSRRASAFMSLDFWPIIDVDFGVLHSNPEKIGELYSDVSADRTVTANQEINLLDTFAGKISLKSNAFLYTYLNASYIYAGRVASANPFMSRNGSQLTDLGTGNKQEVRFGADVALGYLTVSPTFLWRRPLSFPLPIASFGPRSPLTDVFTVWDNREAVQTEIMLGWDPKGDTFFHDWNADEREHADIAASLSFLLNSYLGSTDANNFFLADGTPASFSSGLPAVENTWSLNFKMISNPFPDFRAVVNFRTGLGQSTGEVTDLINYYAGSAQVRYKNWIFFGSLSKDDWGPADWYRNFNITYPWQWTVDIARGFAIPTFMGSENRIGVNFSGKQFADSDPDKDGRIWQSVLSGYLNISW
jgi:beta-galactosidase